MKLPFVSRFVALSLLCVMTLAIGMGFAVSHWGRSITWPIFFASVFALYLIFLPLVRQVYKRQARGETLSAYAERELQSQTERLAQLNALAQTVTASLDTQRIFEAVVQGAIQLLHVALARLWVVEPSTGNVVLVASASTPDRPVSLVGAATSFLQGQAIPGWVVAHRRSHYSPLLAEDPLLVRPEWIRREGLVSELSVPLLRGDQVLGALTVFTWERREFSREEQGLLETFAAQAAGAIENARLLEAERETRRELAVSETRYRELFENIIDIVYIHDLNGKILAVNEAAVRVSGYTREELLRMNIADLMAPEDLKRNTELIRRMISGKRVSEFFTAGFINKAGSRATLEGEDRVSLGWYRFGEPERPREPRKFSESRIERVVRTRKPHASSDMTKDPHWCDSDLVTRLGFRAILEVPVILRDQVIGVLGVLNKSPRTFSPEDVALLVSLAGHTAVALDRTNLLRGLRTRLRETETLLTVSQALGSTLDPTETMRRVAREIGRALGADMVRAYFVEPDQASLRPTAGYHVPKHLLDMLLKFPISLKGHPFLQEAWTHQRAVWTSDAQADPRIDRETLDHFPVRSGLFVPIIVKDAPIGGFFVIWWADQHHFLPEEIRLVEGISRQAALAVENARLYDQHTGMVEQLRLFHHAIRAIGEAVTILDLEGRIIFVNEAFKRMYRWSEAEALGTRPESDASRFNRPEIMNQIHAETLRGGWQGELRSRRKTGEEFPIFLTTAPVLDERATPWPWWGSRGTSPNSNSSRPNSSRPKNSPPRANSPLASPTRSITPSPSSSAWPPWPSKNTPPRPWPMTSTRSAPRPSAPPRLSATSSPLPAPPPTNAFPSISTTSSARPPLVLQAYHLATDQIEVIWKLTEPLPKTLADRGQLQQVIMNLVLNAHQAMKAAHGLGTLWIETGSDDDQVWAQFRDNGPGIPPEVLPRIFDPFLTTKPVGQGTGLGLSVSYGIAQAHGGQLLVDSTLGHGATFTLRLPVVEPPAGAVASPPSPTPASTRSLSVLVVDDEPAVARLLALMLEQLGHRPTVVHSGREALDRLAQGAFDLMTLDLRMPRMSGQEVWHHLQGLPRSPRVLFVTGDFVSDEVRSFLAASGRPYLEKPFQLGDLSRKINDLDL